MEEQKNQKETESKNSLLFKEENEPDFIKNLFNKKISKELEEKLLKDEGKYNKIDKNKEEEDEKINEINTDSKKINKKLHKIEEKNDEEDEENLFPIKSKKQENNSEESLKTYELNKNLSLESQLKGTKTLNDLINEDEELKKQFNQLNNICDYTMKSLNYIVNKEAGFVDKEKLDSKIIENTNMKLNEFLIGPIYEMAKENNFDIDKINKQIEESEKKNYETTHYDNFMKTIPEDQDREMKLKKFQEHFFSKAKQMSTNELLDKITEIINNTKNEEIEKHQKEKNNQLNNNNNKTNNKNNNNENNNNNNNNNNEKNNNNNNNEKNNNENNNEEDVKSEITNAQTENNDIKNNNNNLKDNNSHYSKKLYRGMVYKIEKKEDLKDDKKKENKNIKNSKKFDEDEYESDDDDDADDYNNN